MDTYTLLYAIVYGNLIYFIPNGCTKYDKDERQMQSKQVLGILE